MLKKVNDWVEAIFSTFPDMFRLCAFFIRSVWRVPLFGAWSLLRSWPNLEGLLSGIAPKNTEEIVGEFPTPSAYFVILTVLPLFVLVIGGGVSDVELGGYVLFPEISSDIIKLFDLIGYKSTVTAEKVVISAVFGVSMFVYAFSFCISLACLAVDRLRIIRDSVCVIVGTFCAIEFSCIIYFYPDIKRALFGGVAADVGVISIIAIIAFYYVFLVFPIKSIVLLESPYFLAKSASHVIADDGVIYFIFAMLVRASVRYVAIMAALILLSLIVASWVIYAYIIGVFRF